MKRTFALVTTLCMLVCAVALAACGGGKTEPETYTVTYAANGGEGTMSEVESYKAGETVTTKPADTFTKEGYTFKAWSDGEKEIAAGAAFTMPAKNVTLTAQWEEIVPQLCGVWTGSYEYRGKLNYLELVVIEGDEDYDNFCVLIGSLDDGGARKISQTLFFGVTENEEKAGEYISTFYDADPQSVFQWSESEKTLDLINAGEGSDEAIPMKYQPLSAGKIEDGTYVPKEAYEDFPVAKIVFEGTKATQYATMEFAKAPEFGLITFGNVCTVLFMPEVGKSMGIVLVNTKDGFVYTMQTLADGSYPYFVRSAE